MRIAQIVCSYPPYYSGMGAAVFQSAQELIARGHEVVVYTPRYYGPDTAAELEEQIDHVRRLSPSFSYGNAARLPELEHELNEFDIVHLHYPFFGTAGLVRRWKLRHPERPLVITYHMDNRADGWQGLFFKLYAAWYLPKLLATADRLIGSSYDYLEASDAARHLANYPDKWVELPFGVATERFSPAPKPGHLFTRWQLDPDMPTIIFVGGMDRAHYFKGIPELLKALLLIKEQYQFPLQAVLVGEGNLREAFEQRTKGYGLAAAVRFVGRVDDEELPDYYRMADLCVLPSTTRGEAFGMVLLEAMASGVPVVASDLPGVRTVAKDGGVVVPPGNYTALAEQIHYFFQDRKRIAALRQEVRTIAQERYAWPRIVERLETLYQSLVD